MRTRYANGDPVSDNPPEIQAFEAYVKAERRLPPDVDKLREWVGGTPRFPRGN